MERSSRDIVSYNRDYQHFIQNLQKFHGSRGSGFKKVPFFGGKELDLFLLYKTVTSLGGCVKVTDEKKWREVAKCFSLPSSCTNAAFSLRQYYLRYLASYEKFHFLGEDADDNSSDVRRSSSMLFLQQSNVSFVPNNVQELPKSVELGPLGEPKVNNFDRLMFALVSGLPNEVDFALNICTLLSNVTNSIFNLAKAPNIVDLMLAHVGIFTEGKTSMRELYKEWYQESDRDFNKFWKESIDDETVKEIYDSSCEYGESCTTENVLNPFCTNISKLADSTEAKRVNQVCVILHNFSYEELNCLFISSHSTCKRFLTLCAGSKLTSLRKTALDTLDNLADKMVLRIIQDEETQTELRVLHSFLFSKDRTRKVRAISILAKLSSHKENEDVLSEALPNDIYEELMKCLTVPDIQLILNSLDALYYLSDLGEATATAIVMVYRSIDILVCLVTVHAESYGNRAISGFRIVENKNSLHAQKHVALQQNHQRSIAAQQMQRTYSHLRPAAQQNVMSQVRSSPKAPVAPSMPPARSDTQKQEDNEEVEPEIFAARWISAFYELAPGSEVQRSQIFADYLESCKEIGRKGVLNAQSFFKILGLVIPPPYWRPNETNREDPTITGIKRRLNPLLIKSKNSKPVVRVPDISSQHGEQSMPVRPIPVMPSNAPQQAKVPLTNLLPGQLPGQLPVASHQNMFPGQQQGPRTALPSTALSSQPQMPSSTGQMPLNSQGIPLKLLEQHVNSQGQGKDASAQIIGTPQRVSVANSEDATSKQSLQAVSNPTVQLSQQLVKPTQGQDVALSVTGSVAPGPNHVLLGNVAQGTPSALLAGQGVVTSLVSTPSADLVGSPAQNSLDSTVKLNSQQKLSAKERNERKKAMKAARDMINADIRASNLDPLTQCQNLTERIQKEMQQHFMQFHVHQQSIQAIQTQLQQVVLQNQQAKLPQNVMEDIHTRVRNHHAQMQAHYQKLQQLQILLQQVKIRLTQEQKIKGLAVAPQDTANDSASRTPKISRAARKQPPTSLPANLSNQLQGSSPVFGLSTMQPMNAGSPGQLLATGNIQQGQQFAILSSNMPPQQVSATTAISAAVTTVSVQNSEARPTINQTLPTVIPAQVGFLATNAPVQLQASQMQTPVAVAGPGVQLPQAATPIKQAGTQIVPKPVAITYNTPILPRPSISSPLTIQNVAPQNMQNSALGGQAVLLTMPVMAIPQQGAMQTPQGVRFAQAFVSKSIGENQPSSTAAQILPSTAEISAGGGFVGKQVGLESNSASVAQQLAVNSQQSHLTQETSLHLETAKNADILPQNASSSSLSSNTTFATKSTVMSNSYAVIANGPVSISQANPVAMINGGTENIIGKGPPVCKSTPDLKLDDSAAKVVVNGQMNGISKENSSKFPENNRHLEESVSVDKDDGDRGGIVNGDRVNSAGKSITDVTENKGLTENLKRKHGETLKTEQHDSKKTRLNEEETDEIKEIARMEETFMNRYDEVIKTNKKLKINGVYTNNCKEDIKVNEMDSTGRLGNAGLSNMGAKNDVIVNCSGQSSKGDTVDELSQTSVVHSSGQSSKEETLERPLLSSRVTLIAEETSKGSENIESKTNTCPKDIDTQSMNLSGEEGQRTTQSEEQTKKDNEKHGKKKCQWSGCKCSFSANNDLLAHMVFSHAPQEGNVKICKVPGCKPVQRPRGSMICHFNQVHCNASTVNDDEQVTLPQLLFPKVVDIEREDESPVTRSVRLTAALILRNIARNSAYGRKMILNYETRLVPAAMSSSEASSAVAACLEELSRKRRKQSDCVSQDEAS